MQKVFVRVVDGVVVEVVNPYVDPQSGREWTVVEQFGQDFADQLTEVTNLDPFPEAFWTYDGTTFRPPYVPPVDHVANNTVSLNGFRGAVATTVLSAVIEAVDFGDSTDSAVLRVKVWQDYFKALSAVDLTKAEPSWPPQPDV